MRTSSQHRDDSRGLEVREVGGQAHSEALGTTTLRRLGVLLEEAMVSNLHNQTHIHNYKQLQRERELEVDDR